MPLTLKNHIAGDKLSVGNNSLSDLRKFGIVSSENQSGQQKTGKIINSWFAVSPTTTQTINSNIPIVIDGLSITLVPSSVNSRFLVMATVNGSMTYVCSSLIYRNGSKVLSHGSNSSTSGANVTSHYNDNVSTAIRTHVINYIDSPKTTSAITYDIRHTSSWVNVAAATYVNNRASGDMACPCTLTIIEFES
jgi:hypothetical protein